MCERVMAALAAGERLDEAEAAHLAACSRCAAARSLAGEWRPRRVSAEPGLEPGRVRRVLRLRRARRLLLLGAAAALAVALLRQPRPDPAPEPDLFAAIDEVDALLGPDDPFDEELDLLLDERLPDPLDLGDL